VNPFPQISARKRYPRYLLVAVLLLLLGDPEARADEATLPVLARVGPWPVVSTLVGFRGGLWFCNSVKGRDHNSADVYRYDLRTGAVRYARHLFSQDCGDPVVSEGLLYWPFEDSRFSLGWGHFMVTDGERWRLGTISSARSFHVHAMAAAGGRLIAATSAWRAGLQVSDDGGRSWRVLYDHPTPEGRVSRIVELAVAGGAAFAHLIDQGQSRLLRLVGETVAEVPGWPRQGRIVALAARRNAVYALVRDAEGTSVWRSDGAGSRLLSGPRDHWRGQGIAADTTGLWVATADDEGGSLWHSVDGVAWRPVWHLSGGTPYDIAIHAGQVYVGGIGDDGSGILWGPKPPATEDALPDAAAMPELLPRTAVAGSFAEGVSRALANPESYADHATALRDQVYALARSRPPPEIFDRLLRQPMPGNELSLIGGKVRLPAGKLGRWIVLWGMTVGGSGMVPPALIGEPWTAPENPSEKYFEVPPAAIEAAAAVGQRDAATITALIERLDYRDDPLWLQGDVVGALAALTERYFGYDAEAWRRWWRDHR
jgi:hypothetical protein